MIEFLGTTPSKEACAQVGTAWYRENAQIELDAMMDQLIRQFGPPPSGSWLQVRWNMHDFGSYPTLVLATTKRAGRYGYEYTPEQMAWGLEVDAKWPAVWDDKARTAIAIRKRMVRREVRTHRAR